MSLPTRRQSLIFECKAWAFRLHRWRADLLRKLPRYRPSEALRQAPLLAESVSALWPNDETEWKLVAGKIHNLRLAARALNGIVVPAGATLSFWLQVGRATRLRGYVRGRELREGCLVPSIGGGLCQLSNALYDAAVRAGLQVVERHRHSQVIPGSLAESDRDATVFWNYRDLRLRADHDWRLEVTLDAERLCLRIRGLKPVAALSVPIAPASRKAVEIGDCSGCGKTECHRHAGETASSLHRTWLVNEDWPEFIAYRQHAWREGDRAVRSGAAGVRGNVTGFLARVLRRFLLWRGRPLPQARQATCAWLAQASMSRLGHEDTFLVVPQSLLPYLWMAGELSGRRFDVLMTALPMAQIQQHLDSAARLHPGSPTLRDFRADASLVEAEHEALLRAEHWISPHTRILALAGERAHTLPWQLPAQAQTSAAFTCDGLPRVFLAASPLARKGAYELREAIRSLPVQLWLPPGAMETPAFWQDMDVHWAASMERGLREADVVVLPAWVEHEPRGLLQAIALGKPVIATAACGLPDELPWMRVAEGDALGLREAIVEALRLGDDQ